MAKAFSVLSWNVEHFGALGKNKKPKKPVKPIVELIRKQNADVVAIYEVAGNAVFEPLMEAMPSHQFHITEGPQVQEILIGVRDGLNAFVTQKLEFKSGQSTLRPGVLVTLRVAKKYYPLLFLHVKSMTDPKGFGLRNDMMRRATRFRGVLDDAPGASGKSNYIFLGDLNTMGFNFRGKKHDITGDDEIKELTTLAKYREMRLLSKNATLTWWNGSDNYAPGSNLDHVVAAEHLKFRSFSGSEVDVRGWPELASKTEQKAWIRKHSDHGMLFFEVQRV